MLGAEALRERLGLLQVAAGDRGQHAVLRIDYGRNELLAPDLGGRQNTPAKHRLLLDLICSRQRSRPRRERQGFFSAGQPAMNPVLSRCQ